MVKDMKGVFDYPIRIRYRGNYDYDGLMDLIRNFYARVLIDIKEPKFKFKQQGTGAEVQFKFKGDRKVTHYIKIHLFVEGFIWDVKREDVVIDGKQVRRTNGKLDIKISGNYELDYADKFKDIKKGGKASERALHAFDSWMQTKLDADGTGLQFGDNKVTGKKFMEKMLVSLGDEIKRFLRMECA